MNIAIDATPEKMPAAIEAAKTFHLPLLAQTAVQPEFILYFTDSRLELRGSIDPPYFIDFTAKRASFRYQHASLKNELIARAMGPKTASLILDATAGFGRDTVLLAHLGFKVIALEKAPAIFLLLQDAFHRARNFLPSLANIDLHHDDTFEWLKTSGQRPDVVYLDPMFPDRRKKAKVKKELTILQNLLKNETSNAEALFNLALSYAKKRVVVKRPRLSETITTRAPDFSMSGNCVRFDVYLTKEPNERF